MGGGAIPIQGGMVWRMLCRPYKNPIPVGPHICPPIPPRSDVSIDDVIIDDVIVDDSIVDDVTSHQLVDTPGIERTPLVSDHT